jgi:hypothetical protein
MKYEPTIKPNDMTFERFEKWLLQNTCAVFGLHPSSIGFNFDVNRATAQTAWEAGRERGLFPMALFLKELMDRIVQDDLGHPELQFTWTNIDPTNKKEEAQVVNTLVNGGLMSIDEWRLAEGLKPIGLRDPFIMTPVGPIFVKDLAAQSRAGEKPVAPYKPVSGPGSQGDSRDLKIPSVARAAGNPEMVAEIHTWKRAAINDLKNNKPLRKFQSELIDSRTYNLIESALKTVKTRDDLQKAFAPFLNQEMVNSSQLVEVYNQINDLIEQDESQRSDSSTAEID